MTGSKQHARSRNEPLGKHGEACATSGGMHRSQWDHLHHPWCSGVTSQFPYEQQQQSFFCCRRAEVMAWDSTVKPESHDTEDQTNNTNRNIQPNQASATTYNRYSRNLLLSWTPHDPTLSTLSEALIKFC
jgi:hypothetical protein